MELRVGVTCGEGVGQGVAHQVVDRLDERLPVQAQRELPVSGDRDVQPVGVERCDFRGEQAHHSYLAELLPADLVCHQLPGVFQDGADLLQAQQRLPQRLSYRLVAAVQAPGQHLPGYPSFFQERQHRRQGRLGDLEVRLHVVGQVSQYAELGLLLPVQDPGMEALGIMLSQRLRGYGAGNSQHDQGGDQYHSGAAENGEGDRYQDEAQREGADDALDCGPEVGPKGGGQDDAESVTGKAQGRGQVAGTVNRQGQVDPGQRLGQPGQQKFQQCALPEKIDEERDRCADDQVGRQGPLLGEIHAYLYTSALSPSRYGPVKMSATS